MDEGQIVGSPFALLPLEMIERVLAALPSGSRVLCREVCRVFSRAIRPPGDQWNGVSDATAPCRAVVESWPMESLVRAIQSLFFGPARLRAHRTTPWTCIAAAGRADVLEGVSALIGADESLRDRVSLYNIPDGDLDTLASGSGADFLVAAVVGGRLSVLRWYVAQSLRLPSGLMVLAAQHQRADVVHWLLFDQRKPYETGTVLHLVSDGNHLQAGLDPSLRIHDDDETLVSAACIRAGVQDPNPATLRPLCRPPARLDVTLEWLFAAAVSVGDHVLLGAIAPPPRRWPPCFWVMSLTEAILNGHDDMVDRFMGLVIYGLHGSHIALPLLAAAFVGDVDALGRLWAARGGVDRHAQACALIGGSARAMRWLTSSGCPPDPQYLPPDWKDYPLAGEAQRMMRPDPPPSGQDVHRPPPLFARTLPAWWPRSFFWWCGVREVHPRVLMFSPDNFLRADLRRISPGSPID